mgnify:CR=1 FL=1
MTARLRKLSSRSLRRLSGWVGALALAGIASGCADRIPADLVVAGRTFGEASLIDFNDRYGKSLQSRPVYDLTALGERQFKVTLHQGWQVMNTPGHVRFGYLREAGEIVARQTCADIGQPIATSDFRQQGSSSWVHAIGRFECGEPVAEEPEAPATETSPPASRPPPSTVVITRRERPPRIGTAVATPHPDKPPPETPQRSEPQPPAPPPANLPTAPGAFPRAAIQVSYPSSETRADDVAVIIGNANYARLGRDIPNVVPAYADAEGFKRYVLTAKGLREGNIIHLTDATSAQLVSTFGSATNHRGKLFNWTRPGRSNVYIYYSGHGATDGPEGRSVLVPSDADAATLALTGYPLETLYRNLRHLPAKSITVVLEACFSGASQGGGVVPQASGLLVLPRRLDTPPNTTVISAGAADQIASWERDGSHGLFTKYLLLGLSGQADAAPYGNGDGSTSLQELAAYFDDTVTYYARRYYGRDQTVQIVAPP